MRERGETKFDWSYDADGLSRVRFQKSQTKSRNEKYCLPKLFPSRCSAKVCLTWPPTYDVRNSASALFFNNQYWSLVANIKKRGEEGETNFDWSYDADGMSRVRVKKVLAKKSLNEIVVDQTFFHPGVVAKMLTNSAATYDVNIFVSRVSWRFNVNL